MTEIPDDKKLRIGFSTSACAAAACCSAIECLEQGTSIDSVEIYLHQKGPFSFPVHVIEMGEDFAICGITKDSGDDPDVTNGIEIVARVEKIDGGAHTLHGGEGIGIVTEPGLQLPVGEYAINPGSSHLILKSVCHFCVDHGYNDFFDLKICAPEGRVIAEKTMNPKLGIIGGISILGTDGFVRPYSIPAFRGSLECEIGFAEANGYGALAFTTGTRTEKYISTLIPACYAINVGDDLAYPLSRLKERHFQRLIIAGMIGKISKVAQGRFETHTEKGGVDFEFLSDLAEKCGASSVLVSSVKRCRTAKQAQNLLLTEKISLEPTIARLAAEKIAENVSTIKQISVSIFSLEGNLLGLAELPGVNG